MQSRSTVRDHIVRRLASTFHLISPGTHETFRSAVPSRGPLRCLVSPPSPHKRSQLEQVERLPTPVMDPASDDAKLALKRFSLPKGLKAKLWAAEPMLANPVAIDFDEKGRLFVSETYRYRTSVLDIRDYMGMLELDLASRTHRRPRRPASQGVRREQAKQFAIESEVVRLVEDTDHDGVADKSTRLRRRLQQRARRHRLGRARAPRQGVVHQHPQPVAARRRSAGAGEEDRAAARLRRALQLHRP